MIISSDKTTKLLSRWSGNRLTYCMGHFDGLNWSGGKLIVLTGVWSGAAVNDETATLERRDAGADSECTGFS